MMDERTFAPAYAVSDDDDFALSAAALLASLAIHDEGTRVHSSSVGAWSRRIARHLRLSQSQVTFIERCGVLHDIGKILTPADILTKPGALTADEWTRMRAHPAEGAEMLMAIPALAAYADVVRTHHERPDGLGYPHRLSGTAISFESRIVSVADSFDAMISRRSYRPALSPTAAIEEVVRCRGSQFDPDVVDSLVTLVAVPARIRSRRLFAVG